MPGERRRARLLLAACGLAAASACGTSAPAVPDPQSAVVIAFVDPAGALAPRRDAIVRLIEQTLDRVSAAFAVGAVTITVDADPGGAIPGWGLGGYAPSGSVIEIFVDPAFPDLANVLDARLPMLVAHEMHHVARWRGPGYGSTLLEAMVSEGLADHFSIDLLGVAVPPWSQAFPEARHAEYLALAAPHFDAVVNHGVWFFGASGEPPRWTGYTLGYRLVADYRARTGLSAAQLVNTPAGVFRPQ